MKLSTTIESLLFHRAEPMSIAELSRTLGESPEAVHQALDDLERGLSGRGVALVRTHADAALATAPEAGERLEKLRREELATPLGTAGLEVFTVILYHGPVSRSRIDYIRGVNSTYTLRHLLVRGLVERVTNPRDKREFLYQPTLDALTHLGIRRTADLPEYTAVREEFGAFFKEAHTVTNND